MGFLKKKNNEDISAEKRQEYLNIISSNTTGEELRLLSKAVKSSTIKGQALKKLKNLF